jgi:putative transposase
MRHRSISFRSPSRPAASTLAHCAAVSRMERCSSISAAGFGGLPSGFLKVFIPPLSVVLKCFTTMIFRGTVTPVKTLKTLKLRIKDKHSKVLVAMAREVNQVWNHINAISAKAARPFHGKPQFLSGYDLQKFTAGFSKCDGVSVGSGTVQLVCVEYATRRKQFKKARLNWRVSNPKSSKYSLGWVPFKGGHAKYKAGQIEFAGKKFSLWDSYGLSKYELRAGSFSQDTRGRWYLNVAVEVEAKPSTGTASVGIDLGLKECATTSTGDKLEGRWYRANEKALGVAQRARKKQRVKAIHAKTKNQRKDALHKFSTALVQKNAAIFVGDVASAKLVKTKMAKSTLDAGWSMLKTMLEYKSHQAGIVFEEVNESYSTQTCSQCASIEGPKGLKGLGIREWTCGCGAVHDRDTNAARNILARGHSRLAAGIPVL